MLLRSAFAFLALPGLVAYLGPAAWLWLMGWPVPAHPAGLVIALAGTTGLLGCVREFHVRGRGTLAPWAPPESLVTSGPYRFSRNPMYVGVLLVLAGWAVAFASRALGLYAAIVALAFHLRVVFGEEPWLRRRHGEAWARYEARVPRWLGRPRRP